MGKLAIELVGLVERWNRRELYCWWRLEAALWVVELVLVDGSVKAGIRGVT